MDIVTILWLNIMVTLGLFVVAGGITYIYNLQKKISVTNEANIKQLDGMHEGVLVLSQKTNEIIFFNKPAQKLLTNFVAVP